MGYPRSDALGIMLYAPNGDGGAIPNGRATVIYEPVRPTYDEPVYTPPTQPVYTPPTYVEPTYTPPPPRVQTVPPPVIMQQPVSHQPNVHVAPSNVQPDTSGSKMIAGVAMGPAAPILGLTYDGETGALKSWLVPAAVGLLVLLLTRD